MGGPSTAKTEKGKGREESRPLLDRYFHCDLYGEKVRKDWRSRRWRFAQVHRVTVAQVHSVILFSVRGHEIEDVHGVTVVRGQGGVSHFRCNLLVRLRLEGIDMPLSGA